MLWKIWAVKKFNAKLGHKSSVRGLDLKTMGVVGGIAE